MTACGVAVEEVAFFNDPDLGTYLASERMDNPNSGTSCLSPGCLSAQIGSSRVFTPDDTLPNLG